MDKGEFKANRAIILFEAGRLPVGGMAERLVLFHKWCLHGNCMIVDRRKDVIPLMPNRSQLVLLGKMLDQALRGLPIRLVIFKARKHGVSTYIQAFCYFSCAHYDNQVSNMIAHQGKATVEIFQIVHKINKEYKAPFGGKASRESMTFPATDSRYICHTAGSESGAAGGTPNLLHLSEVALWKKNKSETEYSATQAVPMNADTMIVYESTARGRELMFERFEASHDPGNPYSPVFLPWYFDDVCRLPITEPLVLDDDEKKIVRRAAKDEIRLPHEALKWRRVKIKEIGLRVFRQEFPSTPEEAVQSFANLVLSNMLECYVDALPFDVDHVPIAERVGGMDHGFSDPTVLITAVYRDATLYITKVYRATKKLSEDHVTGLVAKHLYYCDPASTVGRKELEAAARRLRLSCRLMPAPRRKSARDTDFVSAEWELVQRLLRHDRLVIVEGNGTEQILIEADNFENNPRTGQPNYSRSDACGHFDTLDALRYLVVGVCKSDEPIDIHVPTTRTLSRRAGMRS